MVNTDVIALGELLIDFTNNGLSSAGNPIYEANPGGAPCNVLAMLRKLNKNVAFIGKVGDDQFGKILRDTINTIGIDSTNLIEDENVPTTLAFVHTAPDGDRSFSFYRNPGADMMLSPSDITESMLCDAKIFHFGTLSMTHATSREATLKALKIAKENGMLISLDPNLREPLWSNLDEAKKQMLTAVSYCDVLKISDNEIQFLTDENNYDKGIAILRERYNTKLICLTMGKDGSRAYYKDMRVEVPGFTQENVIDTTGAGDTFCGCILGYLLDNNIDELKEGQLREMLTFANAAASIVTTKKGAIKSMPDIKDVENLIRSSL